MLWDKVFFWGLASVGLCLGGYIIYTGWASVDNPPVSDLSFSVTTLHKLIKENSTV
jgi:hypothetical protein